MSVTAMEVARLLDILPDSEKEFAYEFVKKLVLAWDPDYTKVTPEEEKRIISAEKSGFVDDDDIDWSKIGV